MELWFEQFERWAPSRRGSRLPRVPAPRPPPLSARPAKLLQELEVLQWRSTRQRSSVTHHGVRSPSVAERGRQRRCGHGDPCRADDRGHRDEHVHDGVFRGTGRERRGDAPLICRRSESSARRRPAEREPLAGPRGRRSHCRDESPSSPRSVDSSLIARRRRNSSFCQAVSMESPRWTALETEMDHCKYQCPKPASMRIIRIG